MPRHTVLILGHSFVTRLTKFAVDNHLLGFNLAQQQCEIFFHGIPGLRMEGLKQEVGMVESLKPDIVFIDIGTNDLCVCDPDTVANEVFSFAQHLTHQFGVKRVLVSQVLYRDINRAPHTPTNFNERVAIYNVKMDACLKGNNSIHFWRHRGMWSNWRQLLGDGIHFNQQGLRKYFNSVRGAIIAMLNQITPISHTNPI